MVKKRPYDSVHNSITKIAVIGSGCWGTNLVRNNHQLGALGLISDKNEAVMVQFKAQYLDI